MGRGKSWRRGIGKGMKEGMRKEGVEETGGRGWSKSGIEEMEEGKTSKERENGECRVKGEKWNRRRENDLRRAKAEKIIYKEIKANVKD